MHFIRFCALTFVGQALLCSFALASQHSTPDSLTDSLVDQALDRDLHKDPYWLKLLHYRTRTNVIDDVAVEHIDSEVLSEKFFNSPEGRRDPAAELQSTIRVLLQQHTDDDNHPQCRFVARYRWLKTKLDWPENLPEARCQAFQQWSAYGHVNSVSVIFATGYFGNPASFYGHLLVKFNTDVQQTKTDLLDLTLNYGAVIPQGENGLVYVLKGLFGGYQSGFSHSQFYQLNMIYVENELRDLWEYELKLDEKQVEVLVAHAWELLGQYNQYFFAKQNCAFRMAELLTLVIDEPLLNDAFPWAMPGSVFDHLSRARQNGHALVKKVSYIPSRQSRFYTAYSQLDDVTRKTARSIASGKEGFGSSLYSNLGIEQKVKLVDMLFEYDEFLKTSNQSHLTRIDKRDLLAQRFKLPSKKMLSQPVIGHPPHQGPLPVLARFGWRTQSNRDSTGVIQIHPAYFDTLSLDQGRLANATLKMFDLKILASPETIQLEQLDVINVETLTPSRTFMPGDKGSTWRVRAGLRPQNILCRQCVGPGADLGYGKSFSLGYTNVAYLMLNAHLHTPEFRQEFLAASAEVGVVYSVLSSWKLRFFSNSKYYTNENAYHTLSVSNRFGSTRNWDLRFSYLYQNQTRLEAGLSLYW